MKKQITKYYKINKYITLVLSYKTTNILVNGEIFNQCKYLLLDVNTKKKYEEINSIDDAEKYLDKSLELRFKMIDPETEFWGHCSNIQAWAENDYDTRLLHSNLSFPLLKRLYEVGDPIAKRVFKEEIANRFTEGTFKIKNMLIDEFFKYLEYEEKELLFNSFIDNLKKIVEKKGSIIINKEIYVYFPYSMLKTEKIDKYDDRLKQKGIYLFMDLLNNKNTKFQIDKKTKEFIISSGKNIAIIKMTSTNYYDINHYIVLINKKYIITEKDPLYYFEYEPKYKLFKLKENYHKKKLDSMVKKWLFNYFVTGGVF